MLLEAMSPLAVRTVTAKPQALRRLVVGLMLLGMLRLVALMRTMLVRLMPMALGALRLTAGVRTPPVPARLMPMVLVRRHLRLVAIMLMRRLVVGLMLLGMLRLVALMRTVLVRRRRVVTTRGRRATPPPPVRTGTPAPAVLRPPEAEPTLPEATLPLAAVGTMPTPRTPPHTTGRAATHLLQSRMRVPIQPEAGRSRTLMCRISRTMATARTPVTGRVTTAVTVTVVAVTVTAVTAVTTPAAPIMTRTLVMGRGIATGRTPVTGQVTVVAGTPGIHHLILPLILTRFRSRRRILGTPPTVIQQYKHGRRIPRAPQE